MIAKIYFSVMSDT